MAESASHAAVLEPRRFRYPSQKRSDQRRSKTRVSLGEAYNRWTEIKNFHGIKTHSGMATFLMDRYENIDHGPSTSTPIKRRKRRRLNPPALSSVAGSLSPLREHQPGESEDTLSASEIRCLEDSMQDMSVQENPQSVLDVDVDIEEVNDLRNSIIDWSEGEFDEVDSAPADSSDEDFVPGLCIRTGAALKSPLCIQSLPIIGLEETVHDIPDETDQPPLSVPHNRGTTPSTFPKPLKVQCEEDIIGRRAFIVYEDSLRQLASFLVLPVQQCERICDLTGMQCQCFPPFDISITSRGTACIVDWNCANGHVIWRWNSQPTLNFGMQAGDFMLACNILLSGNNYSKIALLFRFMNLGMVNAGSFYAIQDTYCVDTIKECWAEQRAEVVNRFKDRDVVVVADGRMDSPGYCAQYCTYTVMENETRNIISVVTVDKRQTQRNSVVMEKKAFVESMAQLLTELKVVEVCTDAHTQISSLMDKGRFPGVLHSFDMWHGSKNLAKRISAAAQIPGRSALLVWLRDIINHFWWACNKATTFDEFMKLWLGLIHHVTNEHEWVMGHCQHDVLENSSTKEWLERGSVAHEALKDVILNKRWLRNVHKYLTFRSTADLEAFQNHILMYAGKRFSFSPPVYEARTLLAALDYNQHVGRPSRHTADGRPMAMRLYKKKARRWSVYTLKVKKTYDHIPPLQARILSKRLAANAGLPKRRTLRPDDPRRLGLLPPVHPPPVEELMRIQAKRGVAAASATQQGP